MPGIRRYNMVVSGRVQGVGYRAFVMQSALALGISGYVKNQYDGTVLIEAEGPEEKLELLTHRCKAGPGWAHVSGIQINELPVQGTDGFKIAR